MRCKGTRAQGWFSFLIGAVFCCNCWAQVRLPAPTTPSPTTPATDPLGRNTPRGSVFGFLAASHNGDDATAKRYLDTTLTGARAETLAHQLSVVLDRRLPAHLNELSLRPEGSQSSPDRPNIELVGTINTLDGTPVEVLLQRKDQGGQKGSYWLFSKETLAAIPALYEEVNHVSGEDALPSFLTKGIISRISLFQLLSVIVVMPLIYVLLGLLDGFLSPFAVRAWQRFRTQPGLEELHAPKPVRLLLLALVIRWATTGLNLSLLTRQFWSAASTLIATVACVWLAFILNGWIEDRSRLRLEQGDDHGVVSILRLVRRAIDLLVVCAGAFFLLYHFNLNGTVAVTGLGVGGIAIALAAQKTLENMIGGISLIADKVVRVGDVLRVGDKTGTIESIGLRSIRIRTPDRSVVSIPNGRISTEILEDFSRRDKFLFHPTLNLPPEMTAAQMHSFLEVIRNLLIQHVQVERETVRVRLNCVGKSSLDVDVSAYICVLDNAAFLEVQEELLLGIMDTVKQAGTGTVLPSSPGLDGPVSHEVLKLQART
jgi:MscS family membrane protein